MKIFLVDPDDTLQEKIREIACALDDLEVLSRKDLGNAPPGSHKVDVIIGAVDLSQQCKVIDILLNWRTHPHTYLVPCWIQSSPEMFEKRCLWPRLTIDRFGEKFEATRLCDWLLEVADWQQNRMQVGVSHSLSDHSALELLTSLSLRDATGKLTIFDHEGNEGNLRLHDGCLIGATFKHLRNHEAFNDFVAWSSGSYHWEPNDSSPGPTDGTNELDRLIPDALQLIRDANLLFHFLPDLSQKIARTESEAALDDGAVPYYQQLRRIYHFIEGDVSAQDIVEISPLSKPRTMSSLAKWFSLGDLCAKPVLGALQKHRLVIVDDSKLMCKALECVFSKDPRFEIVGVGHDGYEAIKLVEERKPDAVTLDIQMPNMDGLTALKHIMIRNPKPVVILSAFTKETSQLTYDSFKYGAVDVFAKPSNGSLEAMERDAEELRNRIIQASCVRIEAAQYIRRSRGKSNGSSPNSEEKGDTDRASPHGAIIVLCGTGGFPSLLKLLLSLPRSQSLPPMIACMALSGKVVDALIPNLQRDSQMRIQEASHEKLLVCGACYLYTHEDCLLLRKDGGGVSLKECPAGSREHRPFNALLYSAADSLGDRTLAVVISGTGDDGMDGMRYVREAGGQALVLSPRACLKPDLPQRLLDHGYAGEVISPSELAGLLAGYPRVYGGGGVP